MSSIGMIFKAHSEVNALPMDWIPCALEPRDFVEQVVDAAMQTRQGETSTLTINVESKDKCADPCIISVSGVWGETEMNVIRSIYSVLDARFYYAELADFVEL